MKNFVLFSLCVIAFLSCCVDAGSVLSVDEGSYPLIFISAQVDASDIDNAGVFTLYTASSGTATYRIISLTSTAGDSTDFTIGNRNLYIGSTSEVRWTMSAGSLALAGTTSFTNGNGFSPSFTYNGLDETPAGEDVVIKHYGGTLDYVSGSIILHVVIIQTTD